MNMSAKKIISSIAETVGEAVKDSIEQVVKTVDPTKLVEQALGVKSNDQSSSGEFSKYLRGIGGNLTDAELNNKRREFESKQNLEMAEAQKVIRNALPEHLRPRPQSEPSVYEKKNHEEEMKKAQMTEAQKNQQTAVSTPVSVQTGHGAKRKKANSSNFEASKNIKVG